MKKITQWGAIFSLFFCLVSFAMAGDISGNNQAQGLGDGAVQNSAETQWRQAFPDAASGSSGFSRVKNMDEKNQTGSGLTYVYLLRFVDLLIQVVNVIFAFFCVVF